MRTEEEFKVLYMKFDRDVEKRSWLMRLSLVVDQFFNVLFWNGSQDETVSSHIGRRQDAGIATWFDNSVCWFLRKFEDNHCKKSLGE